MTTVVLKVFWNVLIYFNIITLIMSHYLKYVIE